MRVELKVTCVNTGVLAGGVTYHFERLLDPTTTTLWEVNAMISND